MRWQRSISWCRLMPANATMRLGLLGWRDPCESPSQDPGMVVAHVAQGDLTVTPILEQIEAAKRESLIESWILLRSDFEFLKPSLSSCCSSLDPAADSSGTGSRRGTCE